MHFRGKQATPKNDGLPVINGKKVNRRRGFSGPSLPSKGSSLFQNMFVWLSFVTLAIYLFSIGGNGSSTVNGSDVADISQTKDTTTGGGSTKVEQKEAITVEQKKETPISLSQDGYPDKCSEEQLKLIVKQLPIDRHHSRPWLQTSYVKVSAGGHDPLLMRQFYAGLEYKLKPNHAFFGVVLKWMDDLVPINTLVTGSRNEKFGCQKWVEKLPQAKQEALSEVHIAAGAGTRPASVLVVDWDRPEGRVSLEGLKMVCELTDHEFVVASSTRDQVLNQQQLTDLIRSKMPKVNGNVADDQPIHYLDLSSDTSLDNLILQSLKPLWKNIRYLHFQYNYKEQWGNTKLSALLNELKSEGLVCYWPGKKATDYSLWRITDCFVDHYDSHHYANIACVNSKQEDMKPLVTQMESKFAETLRKDHVFHSSHTSF